MKNQDELGTRGRLKVIKEAEHLIRIHGSKMGIYTMLMACTLYFR
jgi:hypothetical protein